MKFAARINSFRRKYPDVLDAIRSIAQTKRVQYLDLNFPEHFAQKNISEVRDCLSSEGMQLNGIALRFREKYLHGAFTNSDSNLRASAVDLCKRAVDTMLELGGDTCVVWLENDGYDYPFQADYAIYWQRVKECFQSVADYQPQAQISLEYKPYEERSFAFMAGIGTSLLLVSEVQRPNFGLTLDYCHMLMKRENPAHSLSLAAIYNKLYGIHFNDGYGVHDDGIIVGTSSFVQALEFVYYIKKYKYDGVIYFDTFPLRESPESELLANVEMVEKLSMLVEQIGMDKIAQTIQKCDGTAVNKLVLECLK